jgi:PAS domain S-box-containing protein
MSKILIVDDEPSARMVLESLLITDGYTLEFATNGLEALEKAATFTPDLMLLDVMMPRLDGFQVCRRLRATPLLADIPVIMITALDDRDSRLSGIEAGADDFIAKPIDRVEMRARVKMITRFNRYRRLMNERLKFERLIELSPNGILIVNATGTVLLVNPAMCHLVGANAEELLGMQMSGFLPPEQQEACSAAMGRVLAAPSTAERFETLWTRQDAATFPSEVDIGYTEWDGEPAIQVIVRDITRRKQAEADLNIAYEQLVILNQQVQRSRDVLRVLFDGLDSGLALIESDGTLLAINQVLAHLLGKKPEELVSQNCATLWDTHTPPFPCEPVLQTLADGQPRSSRATYLDTSGKHHVLDIRTLSIPEPTQSAHTTIAHIADVTEQVQLEAMALDNERFAANGKLAATVAHEVNTPLHTIKTSLYLADRADEAQRSTYLKLAQEEIDRISHILRQLLDLYRAGSGSPVEIDCNAQIERMLLLTGSTLARHGIQVQRDLPPDLPPLLGHTEQITQVLINLILNAVDAMPNGGQLAIRTGVAPAASQEAPPGSQPDTLFIELSDTGIGMSAEVQARIFEPFFTTKPDGSGLGLAVSQKLIRQHGGNLTVQSAPGAGSTFLMSLPLNRETEKLEQAS